MSSYYRGGYPDPANMPLPQESPPLAGQVPKGDRRFIRRWLVTFALWGLFSSVIIDGLPAGAAVLREFGARPTNFLLLLAIVTLAMRVKLRRGGLAVRLSHSWPFVFVLAVPLVNLPIALWQAGSNTGVISDWTKQYLMLFWGIASYYTWRAILARLTWTRYASLMTWACLLPVVFFFLEYVDTSGVVRAILSIFRIKRDARFSSFATEPSIYGAWVAFAWPLVLYTARSARIPLARFAAAALIPLMAASAYLSKDRTFAVIVLLQFLYATYWALTKRQSWGKRIRYLLAALFVTVAGSLALAARFLTLINFDSEASNVARVAYTIAGINVCLAHPLIGVGIGQFGNFFAQYVPQFALHIGEVDRYFLGVAQYRASTFNLFVRLCCEFGVPLGLALSALILRPLQRAVRLATSEPQLFHAALSAAGGVAFWLSQDQYAYQPAILGLAALAVLSESANLGGRPAPDRARPWKPAPDMQPRVHPVEMPPVESTTDGVEPPVADHTR